MQCCTTGFLLFANVHRGRYKVPAESIRDVDFCRNVRRRLLPTFLSVSANASELPTSIEPHTEPADTNENYSLPNRHCVGKRVFSDMVSPSSASSLSNGDCALLMFLEKVGRVQYRLLSNGGFYCSISSQVNSPSFSGRIVPFFDTMLVHQGEGSGTPSEPYHTPFSEVETSHPTTSSIPLPSIPTAPIPPVTQPVTTPIIQYSRRARIAQSSALLTIADEPASPVRDVSKEEACPTESGFIADQDRATIVKSSTLPHDSVPRAQEEEIVKLKDRVKVLEDKEGVAAKKSGDNAPIKGRSINKGEAAAKRISNDSEEIARVLTSMDAATVLAGVIDVPTGSGFIPTVGLPTIV
nr:hypothetical protein [Tanacetum cinerariifolium]